MEKGLMTKHTYCSLCGKDIEKCTCRIKQSIEIKVVKEVIYLIA